MSPNVPTTGDNCPHLGTNVPERGQMSPSGDNCPRAGTIVPKWGQLSPVVGTNQLGLMMSRHERYNKRCPQMTVTLNERLNE